MKFCKSCYKTKNIKYFKRFNNLKYSKTCTDCLKKKNKNRCKKINKKEDKKEKENAPKSYPKPQSIFYYYKEHFRKVYSEMYPDLTLREVDDIIIHEWYSDEENDLYDFFQLVAHKHAENYYKSKTLT
jgi:hypothetical protein